jgi:quinol monooxygenase YgiN
MSYVIVARWHAMPGKRTDVSNILKKLTKAVRTEPGNLGFVVHQQLADPDEFLLYETYVDEAAFLTHRETEHFKTLVLAQAVPQLDRRDIQAFALLG